MDGQTAAVEPVEDAAGLPERAAADAERPMSARTADDAVQPADLLLRDLDRVEPAPAEHGPGAAELAERVPDAGEELGVLLDEEPRAEVAAVLLVAEDAEDEVAARAQLAPGGAEERVDEHRDAALHVERAAAPDDAVDEVARERRARPVLAVRRDDVDVAVEEERRRLARPRDAREQVRARLVAREDPPFDARLVEQAAHVGDAGALVAGRVRRVEPQQVPQQVDDVAHSSASASSRRSTSAAVL